MKMNLPFFSPDSDPLGDSYSSLQRMNEQIVTKLSPMNPAQVLAWPLFFFPLGSSFIQWPKNGEVGTKFTDQLLSYLVRGI